MKTVVVEKGGELGRGQSASPGIAAQKGLPVRLEQRIGLDLSQPLTDPIGELGRLDLARLGTKAEEAIEIGLLFRRSGTVVGKGWGMGIQRKGRFGVKEGFVEEPSIRDRLGGEPRIIGAQESRSPIADR